MSYQLDFKRCYYALYNVYGNPVCGSDDCGSIDDAHASLVAKMEHLGLTPESANDPNGPRETTRIVL